MWNGLSEPGLPVRRLKGSLHRNMSRRQVERKTPSQMDVATWCYKWTDRMDSWMEIPGGVKIPKYENLTLELPCHDILVVLWAT